MGCRNSWTGDGGRHAWVDVINIAFPMLKITLFRRITTTIHFAVNDFNFTPNFNTGHIFQKVMDCPIH